MLGFRDMLRLCRKPLPDGRWRVFHARRNDEMIQALLARALGAKIKIAFTSTAQRRHSRFSRWLMARMDGIISTCTAAAGYLSKPPDIIVPHGVDTTRYQPPASRTEAWRALGFAGNYGVGMFGRVRYSKGTDLLVEAALELLPRHPGATVVICGSCQAGDREFRRELLEKIDDAGLGERIRFIGEQPFERLPDIVSEGEVGYTTTTGDLASVKAALTLLLEDMQRTARMGETGRRLVEARYSVEREAQQLTDYLLGLAAR